MTSRGLDRLETAECYDLLRTHSFGRVGVKIADEPVVLPVFYAFVDGAVVFRTDPGAKLIAAVLGTRVAFEVDDADAGWSVLAIGRAHEVRSPTDSADMVERLEASWPAGERERVVRIEVERVSGRRLRDPRGSTLIEVFADIWCPFTHVGLRRLVAARAAKGSRAPVRVRAWPLEWVNGRPLGCDLVAQEIAALRGSVAPELFAGFDPSHFPTTTIPALGLAAAAYQLGDDRGERLSLRLRDAFFEEGRDLADPAELRAIGAEFGVDPPPDAEAQAAVRADWELGRARNVKGSPHFFVGGRNWFCPSLRVRHENATFDVSVDSAALDEFYATALV